MKLHLPITLLAAIVCVMSTKVALANNHHNTEDYLRSTSNPDGIFEHSFDSTTGAVTIKLHAGDFSLFDMYRSVAGGRKYYDEGIIMGATDLHGGYVYSNYTQNTEEVKSVSITIDGAYKTEGTYADNKVYRLEVSGIGLPSQKIVDVTGSKDVARINITMNSGDVTRIIGGFNNILGSNDKPSGDALGLTPSGYSLGAQYNGSIDVQINGGKVETVVGGNSGKGSDRIKYFLTYGTLTYIDQDGNKVTETNNMAYKNAAGKIVITDKEQYARYMRNKYWAIGGNVNIKIAGDKTEIGNILGAGDNCHSVDGNVSISMSGGHVTGNITAGAYDSFAEVGGSTVVKLEGNAKVDGSIYGTNWYPEATPVIGSKSVEIAPVIKGNSTIVIAGNAEVGGDVCAAGNGGHVEGNTEVYLQDNAVVKGMVSGIGINDATLKEGSTSTLYVGTSSKAYTGSVGSIDGFSHIVVSKGSSLNMTAGNMLAANKQIITLSNANLNTAALRGTSAIVGADGLKLTLISDSPLKSGKYKVMEINSGRSRATANGPSGWKEDKVSVDGIAHFHDLNWDGDVLYLAIKEAHVDAAVISNWGLFKSSQAFTGTLWGNRSNAVVLGSPASAAGVRDDKASMHDEASQAKTLAWSAAYGQSGRISGDGADYSLYGAAIGAERQFGRKDSSIGAAFGYDCGKVDPFTATSAVDQETWHAALYGRVGSWKAGKGAVSVDWSAAYGKTTSEHKDVAGDWSQASWQFDLRATYSQALTQRTTGSVFAGAQYYTNEDATVGDMQFSSMQNLRLMAGGGLSYAVTNRVNIHGQASIYTDAMRHNPHVDINAAKFEGTNPGRVGGVLSIGAGYAISDKWTLQGGYSFDAAKDSTEHNVNAGAQFKF